MAKPVGKALRVPKTKYQKTGEHGDKAQASGAAVDLKTLPRFLRKQSHRVGALWVLAVWHACNPSGSAPSQR